jgi:hypothetical protein
MLAEIFFNPLYFKNRIVKKDTAIFLDVEKSIQAPKQIKVDIKVKSKFKDTGSNDLVL